ncbi:AAA family ATPase [Myxococcus xanthus]|uniref:AAA family ATPase n=1 Tax=Myxococcus xanthus TaxID=34 RepID=UPI00112ACBB3|nr:AAA family ATPase [Myxococcus xanthus]QDE94506.1 DNA repair protein Rad50 [Myxococcus xanthus]
MKPGLRIDALRVLGFGRFSGLAHDLGPGLHLMYGPNEAGKSTLLAFLRSMLFGFEKRGQPERYEPAHGGAFGGELTLTTHAGPLLVRRIASRRSSEGELSVRDAEGKELSKESLESALAHVSRELFFDVFAFRLDELAGFERLTEQRGASEALVAASMRGARRLPEVMDQLRKSTEGIYKPNGVKPSLNETLKALEDVQVRLRQEGDRPARYFAEKERLGALVDEQRTLEAELLETGTGLERLTRLEAALGDVAALAQARAELATLPALETFPEAGESRLEDGLHRRRSYRAEGARLAERLATVEAGLVRLSAPSGVRGREEALSQALAAYTEGAALLRALPSRRAALAEKQRQVELALRELGLPVDGPGLLALDLSVSVRVTLEELALRLGAAEVAHREAEGAWARAVSERERLDGALARVDAELSTLPEERASRVRQQQAGLGRLRTVRAEMERLSEQRAEMHRQFESVRTQGEPQATAAVLPTWWVPAVAAMVVALAVTAWLLAGNVVGALCLVGGLLLTGVLELARRRVETARDADVEAQRARQRWRQQEEERLRAALMSLSAREELLHRELLAAAAEAGLNLVATAADMAAREAVLADALERAGRLEQLQRERETLHAEHTAARREEHRASDAVGEAESRQEQLGAELTALLSDRCFPPTLAASAALTLWRDAAALRQRLLDVGAEEAALTVDAQVCALVTSRLWAEAVVAELIPGATEARELDAGVMEPLASRVAAALEAERAQSMERRTLEERRHELRAEKARLDGLCHDEEAALATLLAEGGSADEETFRRRAAQARRYVELTGRTRELSHRIEARTGLSETPARQALIDVGGEQGLRVELESLRDRQAEAQDRLKAVLTERGALSHQLEQWENDDALAKLRIVEESLRARAAELAKQYAADRLTLALLARARRRFEEEQQPRVVQLASEHFAALTQGRYQRVFIPTGEERELRVGDGQRDWSAAQLSRGTREQLYLAFRLAVVRDFGETRGALPLIVDDVLVNFDPERARGAIHLLAKLSEHQQVIAFTCHPWLRDAFAAEGARVQALDASTSEPPAPVSVLKTG